MVYPDDMRGLMQNIRDLFANGIATVLSAGSAVIGKVGIDQTTDGTSNLVAAKQSGVWTFLQAGFSFLNITTNATTTVKSGAGVLRSATVNALGTVASTVTIYDSLTGSGSKIGTINSLTLSGTFVFDAAFTTGLTIVTTGAPDITISYR